MIHQDSKRRNINENLSHEKVVEHLTISKVVNLFTTILEYPKKTTLTKQINTL